jgi:biopolymer transport protein ExbD
MARGKRNQTLGAEVDINMTPMIDCTFLLIVFFILTTQIVRAEMADMIVPEPTKPQIPARQEDEQKVQTNELLVQAISKAGDDPDADLTEAEQLKGYRVGSRDFDPGDLSGVRQAIAAAVTRARNAGFDTYTVNVRADARLKFVYVQNLMLQAAKAGTSVERIKLKMSFTALREQ